jgi:acyl carrier protein
MKLAPGPNPEVPLVIGAPLATGADIPAVGKGVDRMADRVVDLAVEEEQEDIKAKCERTCGTEKANLISAKSVNKYIVEIQICNDINEDLRIVKDRNVNVEKVLRKIINKAARRSAITITPTCTFKDLGIDSLEVVQILVAIEDTFGIDLQDKDLKTIANMAEFFAYIKIKVAEKNKSSDK